MGNRKEKESNPLQAWRRKEKEKASKAKKKARDDKLAEIPAHRRDPAPLVSEIYQLSVLEYEGRLNSDMKQHKKRLFDQFQSIKKARSVAGLETVELVEFDPVAHEASKLSKRQKLDGKTPKENVQVNVIDVSVVNGSVVESLPELPDGPCPTEKELLALGLPAYSHFPYEAVDDEGQSDHFDDLEAQLEAEYELFKESLDE